jgi:antitoxin PrlF
VPERFTCDRHPTGLLASGKELPYFASMITSKLSSKAQTTIPQPVRVALGLQEGDVLSYRIEGKTVIVSKSRSAKPDDPFATFDEWDSDADRRAYADL